ncbi:hypothetical protein AB0I66_34725 [Streptomyces sp. NPDC050439]|uniref:hypothetical protein n=1 Tax=unclassified Streptomyces TaxID=2593676 RepID=UPI00343259DA
MVLVAGFAGLCSFLFPRATNTAEFLRDARSGQVSVVDVIGSDSGRARVSWSTGFLQDKELSYPADPLQPAVTQFSASVRGQTGAQGDGIVFRERDRLEELGVLDLLVPLMYWRVMPYFAVPVLICCAGILVTIHFRAKRRSVNAGYWLVASMIFAFGFPAYLWSEPEPLIRFRRQGAVSMAAPMRGWRIAGGVLTWLLIGSVLAFALTLR